MDTPGSGEKGTGTRGVTRKGQATGRRLGTAGEMVPTQGFPGHLELFSCARPEEDPGGAPKYNLVLVQYPFRK